MIFVTDSGIPDFGYGIWIGFFILTYIFGTMVFQNRHIRWWADYEGLIDERCGIDISTNSV